MVEHGRVVTNACQITEVKQCRARLVLGLVTGAQVTLPVMCRFYSPIFDIHPVITTLLYFLILFFITHLYSLDEDIVRTFINSGIHETHSAFH